jgi:hypothetical protein
MSLQVKWSPHFFAHWLATACSSSSPSSATSSSSSSGVSGVESVRLFAHLLLAALKLIVEQKWTALPLEKR